MNKLIPIILILLTIIGTTCTQRPPIIKPVTATEEVYVLDSSNINITWQYNRQVVLNAIEVVVDELDRNGIYTKQDMYNAINGIKQRHLENNHDHKHHLNIEFTTGKFSTKFKGYCIVEEKFEDICLSGYFDGWYHIKVITRSKIYNSSFAHELYHFFQRHLDSSLDGTDHEPRIIWKQFFGYDEKGIGKINEAIKKKYP